ncbi:dual specificity mitogen-activated protein kinase kinase 7 isoform X3 [Chelonia mydas]|uniref:dual specificity mitogen-activated protein kinase kinase 7 isoform X3 n=1 Tax=Chelonia mydas TaxID=8469 RepID=UPI001CA80795|nr:dual specificity mitogen-activated protein kinase kinase 7 isoform X3 [Chelonia mydas]
MAAWSPILLLLLWGQSAAAWHWALCQARPLSARHPVLGFWERIRAGTGCASRGRSATGREVHVLVLRGLAGRMGARQVSLELGPAPHGRAPIFVLSSRAPVVWSLQTAQVALGEQWTFQVSPGSRVSALGGVSVTETRLPQTPRGLLRWAHEEHGGVSSLAAYRGVNTVYVRLGDDGVSPGACKPRRNFLSPTHFASDVQPRPLLGCLTSDPPWDPEVHVILSKGARPRYEPYIRASSGAGIVGHCGSGLRGTSRAGGQWRAQGWDSGGGEGSCASGLRGTSKAEGGGGSPQQRQRGLWVKIEGHWQSWRALHPFCCSAPWQEMPSLADVGGGGSCHVSRPPAHLTVELQAPQGCCSPRLELIVVLKSEGTTNWLVRIHHMAGRLRVLASHKVSVSCTEPEPDLALSSSISLGLAYASDPMAWAMEQGLPGVTSYTEAEKVNRFLVIVGLDGDPKAPHPSIPPPRPAKISPMIWERSRAAPGGRSAVGLAGALSVACLSERVVAHVNKDILQAARLSPARVTLRDPSCAAQSNGTHFLLESSLAGCGALRIPALGPTSGIVRYQNAVVLRGSRPGVAPGGSPLPARQAEDSSESIEFSCSSPSLSQPSRSAKPILDLPFHLGRILLSLEVYSSEAFTKAQGPCTVSANSRVFVEAALAAFDPWLSFSIRLCFLSPSSSSSLDSPYILVQGGCPAHPDVSLHPPHKAAAGQASPSGSQELQRLSFLLRPLYNDSIQFLHCRLALCAQEPQGQAGAYGGALPKCGPQARACTSSSVGEPGSGRFQHTFTKPIIVTVGSLGRATKPTPGTADPFLVPFPPAGRRGKVLKGETPPDPAEVPPPSPSAPAVPPALLAPDAGAVCAPLV